MKTNSMTSSTKGVQLFQLIAIIGSAAGLYFYDTDLSSLVTVIIAYFLYGCLGIVVTFHRNLTHNSYNTYQTVARTFSLLGCMSGTGSTLAWVAIHINHHLNSDKSNDPHSPKYQGLKIFRLNYSEQISDNTKWRMKNLISDPFHRILHRYYFLILYTYSVTLFLIGGFWLLIFFHWLPAVITALMSNIVNYIGHKPDFLGAYRRYQLNDQSTNNWIFALPSWGETWHNNHHRYPKNYNCGHHWWEIDISSYVIKLIKK